MIVKPVFIDALAGPVSNQPSLHGANAFATLLDGFTAGSTVTAKVSATKDTAAAASPAATAVTDRIAAKLHDLLASGVSLDTIVRSIAAAVGNALSPGDAAAASRIEREVADALAPPGEPPPTRSDGAQTLAQRLRTIAERVAREGADGAGQQQRSSGDVSDAESARETPAPVKTVEPLDTTPSGFGSVSVAPELGLAVAPAATLIPLAQPATGAAPLRARAGASPAQLGAIVVADTAAASIASLATAPSSITAAAAPGASSRTPDAVNDAVVADKLGAGTAATSFLTTQTALYGDGRRVATAALAQSSAGSTSLGRVLERAASNALPAADVPFASLRAAMDSGKQPTAVAMLAAFETIVASIPVRPTPPPPMLSHVSSQPLSGADGLLGALAAPVPGPVPATTPAPVAPSPVAVADPFHVIDQVVRGVTMRAVGSQSEVRLRLNPEHLGDVTVKLVVNGDAVNASILTTSADARDALAGGASQLNRAFADAGLKLQNLSVDLSGGGFAGFSGHQGGAHEQPSTVRRFSFERDDADDNDALAAVPSFGPPDAANPELGAHNYLV